MRSWAAYSLAVFLPFQGCGGDSLQCGPGTHEEDGECIPVKENGTASVELGTASVELDEAEPRALPTQPDKYEEEDGAQSSKEREQTPITVQDADAEPTGSGPAGLSPYTFTCTEQRLSGTHADTLRVYRNEVFARHGKSFNSADLRAIFGATSWYKPDSAYADSRLTDSDRACLARIKALEKVAKRERVPLQSPDLDGDGTADPVIWDGYTLRVGDTQKTLIHRNADGDEYGSGVILIDLDLSDGVQELVLTVDPGIEDEWSFLVVRFSKGQIQRLMDEPKWMSHRRFSVEPATLSHVDQNCGQETTTTWDFTGGMAKQSQRAKGTLNWDQCAACPFVYRFDGAEAGFVGEILSEQRRPDLERTDRLDLGEAPAGPLRVRLLELKPETTFLDEVSVEVNGVRVAPTGCAAAALAFCADDSAYHRIDANTHLDLVFDLPVAGTPTLVADGYYLPHAPVSLVAGQTELVPAVRLNR